MWYRASNEHCGTRTGLRMQPNEVQQVVAPEGFKLNKIIDVGLNHYATVFF